MLLFYGKKCLYSELNNVLVYASTIWVSAFEEFLGFINNKPKDPKGVQNIKLHISVIKRTSYSELAWNWNLWTVIKFI